MKNDAARAECEKLLGEIDHQSHRAVVCLKNNYMFGRVNAEEAYDDNIEKLWKFIETQIEQAKKEAKIGVLRESMKFQEELADGLGDIGNWTDDKIDELLKES